VTFARPQRQDQETHAGSQSLDPRDRDRIAQGNALRQVVINSPAQTGRSYFDRAEGIAVNLCRLETDERRSNMIDAAASASRLPKGSRRRPIAISAVNGASRLSNS